MTFPIELEKTDRGLAFKLRESEPILVEANLLSEPFDMTFEDRPYGTGNRYGGNPRYGNFGEQLDKEIMIRRLSSEIANAYLHIGSEREISKARTIYGNHPPIERPRIVTQKIQLYGLNEDIARKQRDFIGAFVIAWTS